MKDRGDSLLAALVEKNPETLEAVLDVWQPSNMDPRKVDRLIIIDQGTDLKLAREGRRRRPMTIGRSTRAKSMLARITQRFTPLVTTLYPKRKSGPW